MLSKKGKTKLAFGVAFFMIFVVVASMFSFSVFGQEENVLTSEEAAAVEQVVQETSPQLSSAVEEYVKDFVEKKDISAEQINNISEVDFESLPKEVNIENVNDNNLGIYQVDYTENKTGTNEDKKIFVITYSTEKLKEQGDIIISQDKRELLNFGFNGDAEGSTFLDTATGVASTQEQGYVMMREGSITALSTNLEIVKGTGDVKIIVIKNGEAINFGNVIEAKTGGVKVDYDVQSNGVITFEPGDVISVYLEGEGISYKNVITLLEITTVN